MKFRVLSDLHIDVNRDYDFFMSERDKGMFTVLAGDTSGDPLKTRQWIEQNLKEGVFVSGNHLSDMHFPEGTLVMMVKRGNSFIVPNGRLELRKGDVLLTIESDEKPHSIGE